MIDRARVRLVYVLLTVVGIGAFLYPFWLPSEALPNEAHAGDAPLVAAVVGALAVGAVTLELRRGGMSGATVAILGVLSATAGLGKLLDLPGGGSGVFFLVILAGAAFGARFGLLLGLCSFVVGAILTGGIGPWLPFQMLGLGWIGAGAGLVGRATAGRRPPVEVAALAAYGWLGGFLFGAVLNLWFWPFAVGDGPLSWHPGLSLGETLEHYRSFYVATSLAWDAAGATVNALLIVLTGRPLLRVLRRFANRLRPAVHLEAADPVPFTRVPTPRAATTGSS